MVSQRKRHLFLGLGLAVAFALAVSPASASAVSTLTGESLSGSSSSGNTWSCAPSFSVSGTATAPYPGTFSESGSWTQNFDFNATFTITSGTTTITGTKGPKWGAGGGASCVTGGGVGASDIEASTPYTATIHTPSGNFHDEGTSQVTGLVREFGTATLTESFTSSLTQPVLIAPTNKDQCKNNGWKNFPQFKNQGQCVSSVQSQT
jgi:hypothetical protein